jgi:hypothetical protein
MSQQPALQPVPVHTRSLLLKHPSNKAVRVRGWLTMNMSRTATGDGFTACGERRSCEDRILNEPGAKKQKSAARDQAHIATMTPINRRSVATGKLQTVCISSTSRYILTLLSTLHSPSVGESDFNVMNREESLRVMQLIRLQSARDQALIHARLMAENAFRQVVPIQHALQHQPWNQQGERLAGVSYELVPASQVTVGQQSPSLVRYLQMQAMHQWIRDKEREQRGAHILDGTSGFVVTGFARQQNSLSSLAPRGEASLMNVSHCGLKVATTLDDNGSRCLPAPISDPLDAQVLSTRQVFLRQQMEIFAATEVEAFSHARGRNKRIQYGQVGIRCRHCAHMSAVTRQKGSTYFPFALSGLYQAAQNICSTHMQTGVCTAMPEPIQQEFTRLLCVPKACSGSGRKYWAESAKQFGLMDTDQGIFQSDHIPSSAHSVTHH